jgi:ATP-dependent RNA helicase DeaD
MSITFESFGLRAELSQAIAESGYTEPSPIQQNAIPVLLQGRDVLGQAQTGTGKTAAFALPILNNMTPNRTAQALILAPTRELALQVAEAVHKYGKHQGVRVVPIYGGQSYVRQQKRLESGVDVIVGTPGRMLDLLEKRMLDLSTIRYLVLDEADEMLKMGFIDDVESILKATPDDRQTALFSATLPETIRRLAGKYMHDPLFVTVPEAEMTVKQISQHYVLVHPESRIPALSRMLEVEDIQSALIFAKTRAGAQELTDALIQRGFSVEYISGDLLQDAREAVLRRFRNGDVKLLVATDVVARGVDIPDVSHVFNFEIPSDQEDYVHRIGRTGRAGRSGKAITLVTPAERRRLKGIEHFTQHRIEEMQLPKLDDIRKHRSTIFMHQLELQLEKGDMELGMEMVADLLATGYDMNEVAAAAIQIARAGEINRPIDHVKTIILRDESDDFRKRALNGKSGRFGRDGRPNGAERPHSNGRPRREAPAVQSSEAGMVRLVMDIGRQDGIRPGDIVGSIATHAGIPGKAIGAIDIYADKTFVDVKDVHVDKVLTRMKHGSRLKGKTVKLVRA